MHLASYEAREPTDKGVRAADLGRRGWQRAGEPRRHKPEAR